MEIVHLKKIVEYQKQPENIRSRKVLGTWRDTVGTAKWTSFVDVRASYPSVSYTNGLYIFNIGGNKYRLISRIDFQRQAVSIAWVGDHTEYDRLCANDGERLRQL
jgi:mRNA interferase HigB